jgi:hypothetical protein
MRRRAARRRGTLAAYSIGSPTKPVRYRRTRPTPISSAPNPCSEMASRQAARRVADRPAGMARLRSLVCGRLSPASAYFPANAPTSGAIDSMAWLGSV